jgi:hypothetical protein
LSLNKTLFTGLTIVSVASSNYSVGAAPMVSPNPTIAVSNQNGEQIDKTRDDIKDGAAPSSIDSYYAPTRHPKQLGRAVKNVFGIRSNKDSIHGGTTGRRVIGVESPRDMNLFALEPTVIDEGWYASGRSERHQNIPGTTNEVVTVHDNDKPTYPRQEEATKLDEQKAKPAPNSNAAPNKSD